VLACVKWIARFLFYQKLESRSREKMKKSNRVLGARAGVQMDGQRLKTTGGTPRFQADPQSGIETPRKVA
jgi:hypothetical protein